MVLCGSWQEEKFQALDAPSAPFSVTEQGFFSRPNSFMIVDKAPRQKPSACKLNARLTNIKLIAQARIAQLAQTHRIRQTFFILPDLHLDRLLLLQEYSESDMLDDQFYFSAEYSGLVDTEFFQSHSDERSEFIEVLVQAFKDHKPRYCERLVNRRDVGHMKCGKKAKFQHAEAWSALIFFKWITQRFVRQILSVRRYCGTLSSGCYQIVLSQESRSQDKKEKQIEKERKIQEKQAAKEQKAKEKEEKEAREKERKIQERSRKAKEKEEEKVAVSNAKAKKKKKQRVEEAPAESGSSDTSTGARNKRPLANPYERRTYRPSARTERANRRS